MIWFLYIILDALANWYVIEKKRTPPNYTILTIIRGMAAIVYGIYIDIQVGETLYWLAITVLPFPFVFNTTLNLLRGKPIIYFGKASGWIDSFVVKHNLQVAYFILTVLSFLIGTIFAVIYHSNQ